jgi:hypothetical protein
MTLHPKADILLNWQLLHSIKCQSKATTAADNAINSHRCHVAVSNRHQQLQLQLPGASNDQPHNARGRARNMPVPQGKLPAEKHQQACTKLVGTHKPVHNL